MKIPLRVVMSENLEIKTDNSTKNIRGYLVHFGGK